MSVASDLAAIRSHIESTSATSELVETLYGAVAATAWILDAIAGRRMPRPPAPASADHDTALLMLSFLEAQHRGLAAMRRDLSADQVRLVDNSVGLAHNLIRQAARQTEGNTSWLARSRMPSKQTF